MVPFKLADFERTTTSTNQTVIHCHAWIYWPFFLVLVKKPTDMAWLKYYWNTSNQPNPETPNPCMVLILLQMFSKVEANKFLNDLFPFLNHIDWISTCICNTWLIIQLIMGNSKGWATKPTMDHHFSKPDQTQQSHSYSILSCVVLCCHGNQI